MSLCRRPIRRIALAAKTGSFINKPTLRSLSQQNISTQIEQTYFTSQQQPQLIGEERIDNAIYKVYLKRIRHKIASIGDSTSTLFDDTNEQNKVAGDHRLDSEPGTLLYSTIKVYQLKAGTLEKIIECLTNENGALDSTHMHILFSTYRTYTDTQTLIDALINHYRNVLPASLDMTEDIRQKTLKNLRVAIVCLLTAYKEDFNEPPQYSTLHHFIKHVPEKDLQKQGQKLLEELKQLEEKETNRSDSSIKSNGYSKNQLTHNQKSFDYMTPWNILEMPSTTIAEQLTIVDANLLKSVILHDCLILPTVNSSRRCPSSQSLTTVDKTIEYFNAVVARVIATILKEQDEQTRAYVIEKWIDVAHQCRKLKNFSSLTAILNGLLSGCIYRLTAAWSFVTQDYRAILDELKNIFGSCADRKQARAILDKQLEEVRLAYPESTEGTAKYVDVSTAINATLGKKVSK